MAQSSWNELFCATVRGSIEETVAVLSSGVIDIDARLGGGSTPLVLAAALGHASLVRILLNRGADVSICNRGLNALHAAHVGPGEYVTNLQLKAGVDRHIAQAGREASAVTAVTELLVKAGADLEARGPLGCTPLHAAVAVGHVGSVRVLIEAGANPNSCSSSVGTPLHVAAFHGHVGVIKLLFRAKAKVSPVFLAGTDLPGSRKIVPLDLAAYQGHRKVVKVLIQEHGIEGCGGESRGLDALRSAASMQHVEIMAVLTNAGVVDTGIALMAAAESGREASVKFLLQQEGWTTADDGDHLKIRASRGRTAFLHACGLTGESSPSPRIVRLLMEAGADTTSIVRLLHDDGGKVVFSDTTLAYATGMPGGEDEIGEKEATEEEKLHRLEAIRRLLLQEAAVQAVSWLWAGDYCAPPAVRTAAGGRSTTQTSSNPVTKTLPIMRRRIPSTVLLSTLFRHSKKG